MKTHLEFEPRATFYLDYTTLRKGGTTDRELIQRGVKELILRAAFQEVPIDTMKQLMAEVEREVGNSTKMVKRKAA